MIDQQRLAAVLHGLAVVALVGVEVGLEQQPGHPDDGVHRGPDLVAHGGQERRLGRRPGDRLVPGRDHRPGGGVDGVGQQGQFGRPADRRALAQVARGHPQRRGGHQRGRPGHLPGQPRSGSRGPPPAVRRPGRRSGSCAGWPCRWPLRRLLPLGQQPGLPPSPGPGRAAPLDPVHVPGPPGRSSPAPWAASKPSAGAAGTDSAQLGQLVPQRRLQLPAGPRDWAGLFEVRCASAGQGQLQVGDRRRVRGQVALVPGDHVPALAPLGGPGAGRWNWAVSALSTWCAATRTGTAVGQQRSRSAGRHRPRRSAARPRRTR